MKRGRKEYNNEKRKYNKDKEERIYIPFFWNYSYYNNNFL